MKCYCSLVDLTSDCVKTRRLRRAVQNYPQRNPYLSRKLCCSPIFYVKKNLKCLFQLKLLFTEKLEICLLTMFLYSKQFFLGKFNLMYEHVSVNVENAVTNSITYKTI